MGFLMFDGNARRSFKNFLSASFSQKEMIDMCLQIDKSFDLSKLANYPRGVTIQRAELANLIVDSFFNKNLLAELITNTLGHTYKSGKNIALGGGKEFLNTLEAGGFTYNVDKVQIEKIDKTGKDFGIFFDNKPYYLSFLSIDICGSSKLVSNYSSDVVLEVFEGFRNFVKEKVDKYSGRIWEWEGDGGVAVFHENVSEGVLCAIEISLHLVLFNNLINTLPENIKIRLGSHAGWITYKENYQEMALSIKDIAEDIQKQAAKHNGLVISDEVYRHLYAKIRNSFKTFNKIDMSLFEFDKENLIFSKQLLKSA